MPTPYHGKTSNFLLSTFLASTLLSSLLLRFLSLTVLPFSIFSLRCHPASILWLLPQLNSWLWIMPKFLQNWCILSSLLKKKRSRPLVPLYQPWLLRCFGSPHWASAAPYLWKLFCPPPSFTVKISLLLQRLFEQRFLSFPYNTFYEI